MIRINNTDLMETKITENFKASEFACKHCNKVLIDEKLVQGLQKLREKYDTSLIITSGYRCINHPLSGGRETSQHTKGKAADFTFGDKFNILEVFNSCVNINEFRRIGIYSGGYMHVDNKPEKLYWICYTDKGKSEYRYFSDLASFYAYVYNDKRVEWNKVVI